MSPVPLSLAIETSAPGGGVALLRGPASVAALPLGEGQRQAQNLIPAVQALFAACPPPRPTPSELAFVAVSRGPGSYTGTRLGVMAAKALAYALGVPLLGVSSLAALALGVRERSGTAASRVAVAQPARRDEVYFALYDFAATERTSALPTVTIPDAAMTPDEALATLRGAMSAGAEAGALSGGGEEWVLAGGGVPLYAELWRSLPAGLRQCPEMTAAPAESVGRLAWARWQAGERDDPFVLQPVYLRRAGDPGWRTDALIVS